MITQKELKESLSYCEKSGVFRWINPKSNRVCAGDICGYYDKSNGYLVARINGKKYYTHRLAFLYVKGYMPKAVDHIDRDKTNNSFSNLRECTASQNNCNAKIKSNNTSGIKGVYWHKSAKKWAFEIKLDYKKFFKTFNSKEEAEKFATSFRVKVHREFAFSG